MRKIIPLFLMVLLTFKGQAQQDSLQREILNYTDSKVELITKGRSLLLEKFRKGDYEKVREIKNYLLKEVQNENYIALYPGEKWLLEYWTGEYADLLTSVVDFTDEDLQELQNKIRPAYDMLYAQVLEESKNSLPQLQYFMINSELSEEQKDFLMLYLKSLISDTENVVSEQERLNRLADEFLNKYPDSEFEPFVRKNIRFVWEPHKLGVDFEFFSGYGVLTEELADTFQNNIPLGISLDLEYEKWTLYLRGYLGLSSTKVDQPYTGGVWEDDSSASLSLLEASVGYAFINNSKLKISPFAGIGGMSIGPPEADIVKNPDLERAELSSVTTYLAGLNLDVKLNWGRDLQPQSLYDHSYWFLRFRYAYAAPQFKERYANSSGNMHYLTVGIGALYRGGRRKL